MYMINHIFPVVLTCLSPVTKRRGEGWTKPCNATHPKRHQAHKSGLNVKKLVSGWGRTRSSWTRSEHRRRRFRHPHSDIFLSHIDWPWRERLHSACDVSFHKPRLPEVSQGKSRCDEERKSRCDEIVIHAESSGFRFCVCFTVNCCCVCVQCLYTSAMQAVRVSSGLSYAWRNLLHVCICVGVRAWVHEIIITNSNHLTQCTCFIHS